MKFSVLLAAAGLGLLSVSCIQRGYNQTGVKNSTAQNSNPQVNALAFNALKIWGGDTDVDGNPLKEILELPVSYPSLQGRADADDVFYSKGAEFNPKAIATPKAGETKVGPTDMGYPDIKLTEGLKIEKDGEDEILVYPVNEKSKKSLKLRFTKENREINNQVAAVKYCSSQNLRLPTSREVFDFCTADTPLLMDGALYAAKYPKTGRCSERFVLSATVSAFDLSRAFRFDGWSGLMVAQHRSFNAVSSPGAVTRCVGR